LLDEIDKLGQDFRGDPASALLEVLDPEQNNKFNDHYLEIDLDLSDVMFVTTANSMNLPQALLDRMEIIRLEGYTEDEKFEIAKRHLVEKQIEAHGLKPEEFSISDDALRDVIRYYTREAGVRTLEREIAKLARKSLRRILEGKDKSIVITPENLADFSGVRKFRHDMGEEENQIGAVTGLAWTEVGGELLTIEAVTVPGKGNIKTTGKLGEWHQTKPVCPQRCAHSPSRRRSAQGWPIGRHRHGDVHRVDTYGYCRAPRCCHDWRSHVAWTCVADWWIEREVAGGFARRD
jgi:ATP-dependent Lon protease